MKKKILFVIPEYSHGGTNKVLENLLSFLDKKKYDINIFSLYEDGGDYYKNVFAPYIVKKTWLYYFLHDNVFTRKIMGLYNRITKRDNFNWLYKREANMLQSAHHYDTIIAYQEGTATTFVSNIIDNVKKIAWIHCDYGNWATEWQKKGDIYKYKIYHKIVCVSETAKNIFISVFPEFQDKTVAIYNVQDRETIIQMSNQSVDIPYYDYKKFNIISVGRLSPVKQFDKIPSIISSMGQDIINRIHWYIIGAGQQEETILNEIRNHGMEKVVIPLGAKNNPYPYFKQSDLYVCTSRSESLPTVIIEAEILQTPVLSNCFPSAGEVVDRRCGWICSIDEMPVIIKNIINNKDGIYTKVKKSIVNYEYDNKSIIKQIEELL